MAERGSRMKDRINKPKVFLSHTSHDKPFIEKLAEDLRRCWIDYWLDTEEIRDGRPWLKIIFEDGIPTCDAVIVYLTEDSLGSKMVEKELDATVVEQLAESGITLLPYVSKSALRARLRPDIKTLQCREWNETNYQSVLPTVIAEIWRSYLERTIDTAVLQEKTRRLELELETKRLQEQHEPSVFTPREGQEFQYLLKKLDRRLDVSLGIYEKNTKVGTEVCKLSLLRLLLDFISDGGIYYHEHSLDAHLLYSLGGPVNLKEHPEAKRGFGDGIAEKLGLELQTYGLIKGTRIQSHDRWEAAYEITDKMYRFKYWLEYNNLAPDSTIEHDITQLETKGSSDNEGQTEEDRATARALDADKKISVTRRRNAWRVSGEGIAAAGQAVQGLFDDLKRRVTKSNEVLKNIRLEFSNVDPANCIISNGDVSLVLNWNCPTDSVRDSLFRVIVEATESLTKVGSTSEAGHKQVFASEFEVDVNQDLEMIWRGKGDSLSDSKSMTWLADHCWTTLIWHIQRSEEGNL
jgi:hypothetical protein